MSIIELNTEKSVSQDITMVCDYSNLKINTAYKKVSSTKILYSLDLSIENKVSLNYKLDKKQVALNYFVSKIHLSRNIYKATPHDFEMVFEHTFINGENNNFPSEIKPFDKMYQIFLFKNSQDGPLIDLSLSNIYNIDGNGFINTFNTNKITPKIFFLTKDTTEREFSDLLRPTSDSSIFFLWDSPINYNVQNIDEIIKSTNETASFTDWGNIFIYNLNQYDIVTYAKGILKQIGQESIKMRYFTTKFTVNTHLLTDDIYIDCAPINESVTNVNHYLEKLNGKNNVIVSKIQEMILNSLILIIVSGSVYFSTPAIFRNLLYLHKKNIKETDESVDDKINSGIAVGLGFDLIVISIVIMSVGISEKKQDLLFASFILFIITFSFISSFTNTPSIANSLEYENFSLDNIAIYVFFPLSYIPLYYMRPPKVTD